MSLSVDGLAALLKLAASSPAEAKALIRLVSVDILKNLGGGSYLVGIDGNEMTAQSDRALKESQRFWADLSTKPGEQPAMHRLVKLPLLLRNLSALPFVLEPAQIARLLESTRPHAAFKEMLLEPMAAAASKEEFSALSQLMMSLQHSVLTLPLFHHGYFGFLQLKKRYNKNTKKTSIHFYAALHRLGPVEGSIDTEEEGGIRVTLNVAFESTLNHLENNSDSLPYPLTLRLHENDAVTPLWDGTNTTLLDISI